MIWEEKVKYRGRNCPCPTYCPECVVNQYKEDQDECFTFYLFVNVMVKNMAEAVCTRCGHVVPLNPRARGG